MAPSAEKVARGELRDVVENVCDNDFLTLIAPTDKHLYTSGFNSRAKDVAHWRDTLFKTNIEPTLNHNDANFKLTYEDSKPRFIINHRFKKGKLNDTDDFLHDAIDATKRNMSMDDALKELFDALVKVQAADVREIFDKAYRRDYNASILNSFRSDNGFLKDLDHEVSLLWDFVRGSDRARAHESMKKIIWLFNAKYFGHHKRSRRPQEGLGLIRESIVEGFRLLGFNITNIDHDDYNNYAIDLSHGWDYLSHNVGTTAYPNATPRDPNKARGDEYFYAWWVFDSEQDYNYVAQAMIWPRHRQEQRNNYREPGRKMGTLAELLSASKGTGKVAGRFLGARDIVDRNQPFTDEVPMPALLPGQVIALGAARAKLFDIATKEVRLGNLWHTFPRSSGMTIGDGIRGWIREGKLRFDSTNLVWHWTKWGGALPIDKVEVRGRVVNENEIVRSFGPGILPCKDDAAATALMNDSRPIGLNHMVEIELLDDTGSVKTTERVNADPEGRFSASIPINVEFRVSSPSIRPFGRGVHTNGWQKSKTMVVKPGTSIGNIIVPKKAGDNEPDIKQAKPSIFYHYIEEGDRGDGDTEKKELFPSLPAEVALKIPKGNTFVVEPEDYFCFIDEGNNEIPGSKVEGRELAKYIESRQPHEMRIHYDNKPTSVMPTIPPEAQRPKFVLHMQKIRRP